MQYDFFISYSNKDAEKVTEIVKIMQDHHAKCWFQLNDSKQEYAKAIMEGIHSSRVFIIFVSQASATSMAVLNEIDCAIKWYDKSDDFKILPVVLGENNLDSRDFDQINYYLGRLNMIFEINAQSNNELVSNIFKQVDFGVAEEKNSLYHSGTRENKRIAQQNFILSKFAKETFKNIVSPSSFVLDIGCANGNFITECLKDVPYSKLLGVDLDKGKIDEANKLHASDKNLFTVCDVLSDSFADTLDAYLDEQDKRGFDVIHISHLLLHMKEPVALLKMIKRYLNKTGYLIIQDEDDGSAVFYPEDKFFENALYLWKQSEMSGDRHCGRKIFSYLHEAGYKNINLTFSGLSNVNLDKQYREALWDYYFNYHLWGVIDEKLFKDYLNTEKVLMEYSQEYEKCKEAFDKDEIFVQLGFMIYTSQK